MDVEKTIEFLLREAARNEARAARNEERWARNDERWAKSDVRLTRLERVMAQNNRVVTRLVQYGVSLRSDVRRLDRAMAETNDKLNALIDTVDKMIRKNGGSGNGQKRS